MGFRSAFFYFVFFITLLEQAIAYKVSAAIPEVGDSIVSRSIYPSSMKDKSTIYNKMWGMHYRRLYTVPIKAPSITLDKFMGGVKVADQVADFHGLLLENSKQHLFLLKPVGGSTSFIESSFFQEMYNKTDFENTYLDRFIGDAYTIINPFTFIAADNLARIAGLNSNNSRIFYIPKNSTQDTIVTGSSIEDRLVTIIDIPDLNTRENIALTQEMLEKIRVNDLYTIDQSMYVRERLFDMLIGDWNKIPENWNWQARKENDSILFSPIVIDRNHAFTKVDGLLFKQMLNVLSLSFITDYDPKFKNLKKINSLGFALDMALTNGVDESVWLAQAAYLQNTLTDQAIDDAFKKLPSGIEGEETDLIKKNLKERRSLLSKIAREYFYLLQRNPVITGTDQNDEFLVERSGNDSVRIRISNPESKSVFFDRKYRKKDTKEIWLYGLEGNDSLIVKGDARKEFPIYFISGKGDNSYNLESGSKIKIFAGTSEKEELKTVSNAKVLYSDLDTIHNYDYQKIKYNDVSFTPWGIYDSDNGISLGVYLTFTKYGFKRSPFSYRHRIGYNYIEGLMYQGIFPSYDGRKTFYIDAFISSPNNFFNFFGFGSNTDGYKDEKKNYNRVKLKQRSISPSFQYDITNDEKIILHSTFETVKASYRENRFIGKYYTEDNPIFDTNFFMDLGATVKTTKNFSSFISKVEGSLSVGWKMNLKETEKNFPYTKGDIAVDVRLSDRFTFATKLNGEILFNDNYEFYQSATTELRGFRDNRFIGKQSFYQFTDLRVDMGQIKNPFTPLKYGLFVGADYGRVWFPEEDSKKWHSSYGGGIWLTIINKITTKYSMFGSNDNFRFMFELGMGF